MERNIQFTIRLMEHDDYLTISHETDRVLAWMRTNNLLLNEDQFICDFCHENNMHQIQNNSRIDGYRMKCRACGAKKSIRGGSVFEGVREPLIIMNRVIFCSFVDSMTIAECSRITGLSTVTIIKYYKYCRKLVSAFIQESYRKQENLGVSYMIELKEPGLDPEDMESFEVTPSVEVSGLRSENLVCLSMV